MADLMFDGTGITGWVFDGHLPPNSPEACTAGYKFDTFPGRAAAWNNTPGLALVSGTAQVTALWLPGAQSGISEPLTKLSFKTGATAGGTMTHWWLALSDITGRVLAVTADQVAAAIPATTLIPLATTVTFIPPYTGWYYLHTLVTATTMPTLESAPSTASNIGGPPVLAGVGSAGLTTPPALQALLAVPTAGANFYYGAAG